MNHKQIYLATIGLLFTIIAPQVVAQDGEANVSNDIIIVKHSPGLIRNVHLQIEDQVSDKCWTNSNQIKQKARLTLEQSGIHVYDEPLFIITPFSINLVITGLGERSDRGTCYGNIAVQAYRKIFTDFLEAKIGYFAVIFYQNSVALNSDNLNESFLNASDTFVSQLASDIIASRREPVVKKVLGKMSDEKTKPLTMRRYFEILKSATSNQN